MDDEKNKETNDSAAPAREEERALVEEVARLTARLQAESAAHQRTEAGKFLLSSIVESSEDSIVSITFDAVITSWNKAAERLYGYPAAEVLGQPLMKLTLPEDLQEVLARIDNVKHHQAVELFTTTRVRKDGSQICLSVQMSPIKDAKGSLIGISTIGRDISARIFAEEMVRATVLQTQVALDYAEATLRTAPVPLLVLEDDLRMHTANEAFYKNFQVTPDESEGRLIYELGNGQWNIPNLRKLLEEILPKNNPFKNFEVTHEFEAIGRRTMLLSAQRMENEAGQPLRIVLAIEDITERKGDEDSRATLAAVVESSDDAIISKNLDGIITSWNGGAERLFGYSAREAIGQPVMMLIPPELEKEEPGILERIRHGESLGHHETVRRRKDRTLVDVSLTVSPIFDAHGQIVGASKVARDITDRRRAQEALRESQAALEFTLEAARIGDWDLDLIHDTSRRSLRHDQCLGYNEPIPEKDWGFEVFIQHVHPEDRARVERDFREAVSELKDWQFECRVIWPDESIHWIAVHGSIYRAVDGKPVRMLGIIANITERKQAEQALLESRQRTTNIIESITDAFTTVDKEWRYTFLNQRAEEILRPLQKSRENLLGKSLWEEFPDLIGRGNEED